MRRRLERRRIQRITVAKDLLSEPRLWDKLQERVEAQRDWEYAAPKRGHVFPALRVQIFEEEDKSVFF